MTRSDLVAYLAGRYAPLAAAASLTTTDDASDFGPALDDSYDALGMSATEVAALADTDPLVSDLRALGRYYTLRLLAERLSVAVDVVVAQNEVSKKRSQMFTQVQVLLAAASAEIERRGYGPQVMQMGRLQLDIFEPIVGGVGYGSPLPH